MSLENDKIMQDLSMLYEGIFSSTGSGQPPPSYDGSITFNGTDYKIQAIRTPNGWKTLIADPTSKQMKPISEVLGELLLSSRQNERESSKEYSSKVAAKSNPKDIDVEKFTKYHDQH